MYLFNGDKYNVALEGKATYTYKQLGQKIVTYSKYVHIDRGDKVLIYSENSEGWIFSFYTAWHLGACIIPVDAELNVSILTNIIHDSTPDVIFTTYARSGFIKQILKKLGLSPKFYIIEDLEKLELVTSESFPVIEFSSDETVLIMYTSGTTGNPKGVMLSSSNIRSNIDAVTQRVKIFKGNEVSLLLLPLHHLYPLMGSLILPFFVGSKVVISNSIVPSDFVDTMRLHKITSFLAVPRLLTLIHKSIMHQVNSRSSSRYMFSLVKKVNRRWFSRFAFKSLHNKFGGKLTYIICGGAKLDENIARDYHYLGFKVLAGYGTTETSPMIAFTRPSNINPGSVGFVLPNCEVGFDDGEILVRGGNVMQGYLNKPVESAEIIKNDWFYTGDLGWMDNDGFLYITGRKKDIIVLSNGKNVNPEDIEEEFNSYTEWIKECGVYQSNDMLKAIIVPTDELLNQGKKKTFELIKWDVVNKHNEICAPYKKIHDFTLTSEELPRTRLIKIKRFMLPQLELEGNIFENEAIDDYASDQYNIIKAFIEKEKGVKVYSHYNTETDLAFDSLDRVGMQIFLSKKFGVDVDSDKLCSFKDVKQLSDFVSKNQNKIGNESVYWSNVLDNEIDVDLPEISLFSRCIIGFNKAVFKLFLKFKYVGISNIPNGACILTANHQSSLDAMLIASLFKKKELKDIYYFAKEKHFKSFISKAFARRSNIIVVDEEVNLKESIQKLAQVLRNGKKLVFFPEGTRTADGTVDEFKRTFAVLSKKLDVPIIPVTIKGANNALPKGSLFIRPFKRIKIVFHKVFNPSNYSYQEIVEKTRLIVLDELYREDDDIS